MKFSISNIGWRREDDLKVAGLLRGTVFTGVEVAPTRYFENVEGAEGKEFLAIAKKWKDLGLEVTSLQSLLFNRPDLQLFGTDEQRSRLKTFLWNLRDKAALMDVGPMVFGSPKNRLKGALSSPVAWDSAENFFRELEQSWPSGGPFLVLEANPEIYGCDFITKTSEALDFISKINVPMLRWHIDLACTTLAGESAVEVIASSPFLPAHVHLSETNLGPLKLSQMQVYEDFLSALRDRHYSGVVTLEMKDCDTLEPLTSSIQIIQELAS